MKETVCAAAIQMQSSSELAENLNNAGLLIDQAVKAGAELLVLPENFALMAQHTTQLLAHKEESGSGPIQDFLSKKAKQHKIWLIGGSVPLETTHKDKVYAACLVFNHEGESVAQYNKLHLFDVELPKKQESYRESDAFVAGAQVVTINTPFGVLGLSICYDVRFPELYRALAVQGAEIIAVPSAFTQTTGVAHWSMLCKARAVENSCYLIAANQCGEHANGRKTFGHSTIVDPWGEILAEAESGQGVIVTSLKQSRLVEVRSSFPVLKHRRFSFNLTSK
ncbi:MAG: hypothetical protein A6F71_01790 [Cycloclasticus sp. symbiont of Poecilosclerida sp. M]|nr:MAG: hypothetical protein A6F71_01790 [Cycloclasticus sp. symbiont of Poecilosclerida sp. M]